MDKERNNFLPYWDDFITQLRGRLISFSRNQNLGLSQANMILSELILSWGSEYDPCGRWIMSLEKKNAEKAKLILDILLQGTHFRELETKKVLPGYYDFIVPALSAAAGFAGCYFLGASRLMQAGAAVLSACCLLPVVRGYRGSQQEFLKQEIIREYIAQLTPSKEKILSILA